MANNDQGGLNILTGLIPVLYAALQVVSRELVGFIPAASRNMTADGAALNQSVRVPITSETDNMDITPGTPPVATGTAFDFVDLAITKNRIAKPISWNGDEQVAVGGSLNGMMVNQYAQAMRSLVNEVERDVCLEGVIGALQAGNVIGTPGNTPFGTDLSALAQVKKYQDDLGTPMGGRHLLINTSTGAALRSLEKLTNVNQAGEDAMLRRGVIHDLMGYAVRESGGFRSVDPGTQTGLQVTAATAAGSTTLPVTALTGTLNMGAILLIAGQNYTVTAPAVAGNTSVSISPPLKTPVAANGTVGIQAAYMPNVAFSSDFVYLAPRTPLMPEGGDGALAVRAITDPVSGLSFQVAVYDDYRQIRVEIGLAWGVKAVNKRHGLLLLG